MSFTSFSVTIFAIYEKNLLSLCTLLKFKAMAKYMNSISIVKIEAKTDFSQKFHKIYQKVLFQNQYWYIIYTINKYFLYGGVIWLTYILQYNTFFNLQLLLCI